MPETFPLSGVIVPHCIDDDDGSIFDLLKAMTTELGNNRVKVTGDKYKHRITFQSENTPFRHHPNSRGSDLDISNPAPGSKLVALSCVKQQGDWVSGYRETADSLLYRGPDGGIYGVPKTSVDVDSQPGTMIFPTSLGGGSSRITRSYRSKQEGPGS